MLKTFKNFFSHSAKRNINANTINANLHSNVDHNNSPISHHPDHHLSQSSQSTHEQIVDDLSTQYSAEHRPSQQNYQSYKALSEEINSILDLRRMMSAVYSLQPDDICAEQHLYTTMSIPETVLYKEEYVQVHLTLLIPLSQKDSATRLDVFNFLELLLEQEDQQNNKTDAVVTKKTHSLDVRTEVFRFRDVKKEDDNDNHCEQCIICQQDYNKNDLLRSLSCQHSFHCGCIDKWLNNKGNCPVCRMDILQTSSSSS